MSDTSHQVPPDLREQAERVPTLEADLANQSEHNALLALENAGLRAGIDLTTRQGNAWAATYDGDWSDGEAMKADFNAMFPAQEPPPRNDSSDGAVEHPQAPPTPDPNSPSGFQTGMGERADLGGTPGVPPVAGAESDPYNEGFEAMHEARKKGLPESNARAEVFNRVIDAAASGDERVIWSEEHRAAWMEDTGARYHQ